MVVVATEARGVVTLTTQSASAELTDGFHLLVDAMKLNGIDTIYGLVGIPVTDLARLAQASGIRFIGFRQRRGRGRVFDPAARRLLDGLGARLPQRPGGAGECHDELLSDDPDLGVKRATASGYATR
jgi:hypothetical protein